MVYNRSVLHLTVILKCLFVAVMEKRTTYLKIYLTFFNVVRSFLRSRYMGCHATLTEGCVTAGKESTLFVVKIYRLCYKRLVIYCQKVKQKFPKLYLCIK